MGGAANATGGAGDGVFDAKDAQYTNVRIWRDLNQDGISQAGEMQTLQEAGIASVKLSSTKTETNYGDAQLVQSGSFTRADGSEGQAGSFILAQNNVVTTHAPIAISTQEEEATAALMAMGAAFTALPRHQRCRHKAREQRNLESGPRAGRAIKLETFTFTRYGTAKATVDKVTQDAVNDENAGDLPGPVEASRTSIDVDGKQIKLAPGMNITAEIKRARDGWLSICSVLFRGGKTIENDETEMDA